MNDVCNWIYRPGENNSHWAYTTCKKGFNFLSRINDCEPYVGVADWYNGKQCPICKRAVVVDYRSVKRSDPRDK